MLHRIGFTLIEVVLVLIILVLLATLGIPLLRGTLAQQELKYSADITRGEWLTYRVKAMEEGQIFCVRAQIGGNVLIVNRILDTAYTAGLSSRQTTSRFDVYGEYDPYEKGGFTGSAEDFILRNPDSATTENGTIFIHLPKSVVIADVITVAEERAAFYLGLTVPEGTTEDNEIYGIEAIMTGEIRLGETPGQGGTWSSPIFFYPDGSSSTAAILLKNNAGRCIEVRLRGLTGTGMLTAITLTTDYVGELLVDRF